MTIDTKTRIDYVEYSKSYDFPEIVEDALEHHFAEHRHLYQDEIPLKRINLLLLINPCTTPEEALKIAHSE
jgi:hypothetical protein